jgi:large subunit ribosomal protein L23
MRDPYSILIKPVASEKAIKMAESENKLVFIVDRKAKKPEIKEAVEKAFNVKVIKVNTYIAPDGKKRAIVRLSPEFKATDIEAQLGITVG